MKLSVKFLEKLPDCPYLLIDEETDPGYADCGAMHNGFFECHMVIHWELCMEGWR